jgi:hypothetical protein
MPFIRFQWLVPFAVQLIPGGLMALGCFMIRESPRWLRSNGNHEKTLRNLSCIRALPSATST